ncbi:unnamed protein product [Eruca vesicaria subsp. sativa]|uniref:proline--tRNA ligase n=1 Tax=Eruca vesicaria subsp. sativa TaxID=29727 RepID=A0ABC8JAS7_ERUVS|nr:unnamed protein product [Eruca vesicaria subsp. sativa]
MAMSVQSTEGKRALGSTSDENSVVLKSSSTPVRVNGQSSLQKEIKKETRLGISTKKDEDFGKWYSEVCRCGDMLDYYDIKGCYILKPPAVKVWGILRAFFDAEIEKMGVEEYYFPLFVSPSCLEKEKDHIKGFSPEVAWVTRAGESELSIPIAVRPTSETVIYPYFSKWIRGHRDLPLKINQWVNVVRWEFSDPIPFIRSREFLWQEGHTAFATKTEADKEVFDILQIYSDIYEKLLAVPVIKGIKSENEKFAGGLYTATVEAFIPSSGRGIQAATSHSLGQNFAEIFGISFENKERKLEKKETKRSLVWQNSWGISTRSIGVMVMTHGDDKGLVFPPLVAPVQVVVIPVPFNGFDVNIIYEACEAVKSTLLAAGIRAKSDNRDTYACGWKYADWEQKGVPLRIEIGPRDLAKNQVRIVRRDNGAKADLPRGDLIEQVKDMLGKIQQSLFDAAKRGKDACTQKVENWDDFMEALSQKKLILAPWCDEVEVEKLVKERTKTETGAGAKTLCTPLEQPDLNEDTLCFASGKPAKKWSYWGRSY